MRLVLCVEIVQELAFRDQCALARDLGFDGVEIAPYTLSDNPHRLAATARSEIVTIAADHGLFVSGLHSILSAPANLSITTSDVAVRERTLDVMKGLCDLCADLGGSYVVHGGPQQRQLDASDAKGCWDRGVDAFAKGAEYAGAAGLSYLIEPIRPSLTGFVNTVAEAVEIIEALAIPSLKTMIDCCSGSQAEAEPIPVILDRWVPTGLLAHLHANDANRLGPGQGEVRFIDILAALKRNGYAGLVSVEPFVPFPSGPLCAARAAGYMRGLLEALASDSVDSE
jgi:D-psicose/D-tagatose/L-ribulose 3-epimerase